METQTEEVETQTEDTSEPSAEGDGQQTGSEDVTPVDRPATSERKSRKAARLDVEAANRERDEIRRSLETERQERSRLDREVAEMKAWRDQQQQQAEKADKHAEQKNKIKELRESADDQLARAAQLKDNPVEAKKAWDRWRELNDQASRMLRRIEDEDDWNERINQVRGNQPDPVVASEAAVLAARFPWANTNRKAMAVAIEHEREMIQSGAPPSRETSIAAMAYAAKVFGLGGESAPTNGQKARYGGVPSGEGAGGGSQRQQVALTRENEAMALAAYRHLEPKAAKAQWLKDMAAWQKENESE